MFASSISPTSGTGCCVWNSDLGTILSCFAYHTSQLTEGITCFVPNLNTRLFSLKSLQLCQAGLFFSAVIVIPWTLLALTLRAKARSVGMSTGQTEVISGNEPKGNEEEKEKNLVSVISSPQEVTKNDDEEEDDYSEEFAAPLHLHTLKSPARLRGMPAHKPSSRSSSLSRSRSASPQPGATAASTPASTVTEHGSSLSGRPPLSSSSSASSLTDGGSSDRHGHTHIITEDLLTDRLGLEEVEPPSSHAEKSGSHSSPHTGLPPVNERMCEDSLEDVHAFQDLKLVRRMSGGSDRSLTDAAGGGGSSCNNSVLETLDEEDSLDDEESSHVDSSVAASGSCGKPATPRRGSGGKEGHRAPPSPEQLPDCDAKALFDMLDVVSTPEERKRLELERKRRGMCSTT